MTISPSGAGNFLASYNAAKEQMARERMLRDAQRLQEAQAAAERDAELVAGWNAEMERVAPQVVSLLRAPKPEDPAWLDQLNMLTSGTHGLAARAKGRRDFTGTRWGWAAPVPNKPRELVLIGEGPNGIGPMSIKGGTKDDVHTFSLGSLAEFVGSWLPAGERDPWAAVHKNIDSSFDLYRKGAGGADWFSRMDEDAAKLFSTARRLAHQNVRALRGMGYGPEWASHILPEVAIAAAKAVEGKTFDRDTGEELPPEDGGVPFRDMPLGWRREVLLRYVEPLAKDQGASAVQTGTPNADPPPQTPSAATKDEDEVPGHLTSGAGDLGRGSTQALADASAGLGMALLDKDLGKNIAKAIRDGGRLRAQAVSSPFPPTAAAPPGLGEAARQALAMVNTPAGGGLGTAARQAAAMVNTPGGGVSPAPFGQQQAMMEGIGATLARAGELPHGAMVRLGAGQQQAAPAQAAPPGLGEAARQALAMVNTPAGGRPPLPGPEATTANATFGDWLASFVPNPAGLPTQADVDALAGGGIRPAAPAEQPWAPHPANLPPTTRGGATPREVYENQFGPVPRPAQVTPAPAQTAAAALNAADRELAARRAQRGPAQYPEGPGARTAWMHGRNAAGQVAAPAPPPAAPQRPQAAAQPVVRRLDEVAAAVAPDLRNAAESVPGFLAHWERVERGKGSGGRFLPHDDGDGKLTVGGIRRSKEEARRIEEAGGLTKEQLEEIEAPRLVAAVRTAKEAVEDVVEGSWAKLSDFDRLYLAIRELQQGKGKLLALLRRDSKKYLKSLLDGDRKGAAELITFENIFTPEWAGRNPTMVKGLETRFGNEQAMVERGSFDPPPPTASVAAR